MGKIVCNKHEIAYESDASCTYCEGMKEDRFKPVSLPEATEFIDLFDFTIEPCEKDDTEYEGFVDVWNVTRSKG
jgi:hypothetical protein